MFKRILATLDGSPLSEQVLPYASGIAGKLGADLSLLRVVVDPADQEGAREYINRVSKEKKKGDRAGVVVFGSEASIESMPNLVVDVQKIYAVVGTSRSDLAAAIRRAQRAGAGYRRVSERHRRGTHRAPWGDSRRLGRVRGASRRISSSG